MSDAALTYVELDIDACPKLYGTTNGAGSCAAVLGVDSATKCFNTIATCAKLTSYLNLPVTLRFSVDTGHNPVDIEALPFIASHDDVSITPGRISLGEDLGQRESVSINFIDRPHSDTGPGFDKYLADRPYDPYSQGTFWGKFRARQPYLKGRNLRVYRGFVGQALADMECRHYIIDSYTGPEIDGRYTIVAKDILKLLDGDQAQAPALSTGSLASDITNSATTATLSTGSGNGSNYGSAGKLAIGGTEVVSYYRDPTAGNDANTKLLLHFDGTDAATAFTDSSASARTATAVGNAQLDTAKQKFGTASLLLDGIGDYVTFPDSADWTFGTAATIDAQVWFNALPTLSTICSHATDANNQYRWTVSSTGVIAFTVISASSTIISLSSAAGVITTGQFYHLELVKAGNDYAIRVNGVAVATVTDSDAIPNFTSTFKIGADGGATNTLNGWIDEFRFSSVARHAADWTDLPGAPYNTSSDLLTLLARGLNGTTADAHSAGDRVQVCVEYTAARPDEIVADLMQTYGGVDPSYIPATSWQTETETFNRRLYTGIIAEPTPVRTLIQEMIQQAGLAIWWDPVERLVFLQVLRAVTSDARVFDESQILEGTLSIAEQPDKRVSQVWVYYGQRNPLDGQDDPSNYRSCEVILDTTAEANYGAPAIQKIYSRWIAFGGQTTAERIGNLQLGRYVNPPRKFAFNLLRTAAAVGLVLGAGYFIGNPELQAADGSRVNVPVQITRDRADAGQHAYEAEENRQVSYDSDDNLTVVIDSNIRGINLRTLYDTLYSAPLPGDTVTFVVNDNVVVGATSATLAAIDTGTWPSTATTGNRTSGNPTLTGIADTSTFTEGMIVKGTGIPAGAKILSKTSNSITLDANATSGAGTSTSLTVYTVLLVLDVHGRVQGAGGTASNGASGPAGITAAGQAGGTALKATSALSVIVRSTGSIKGGGGGGGGAGTRVYSNHNGGGGGGGAGDTPGPGGYAGGPYAANGGIGTLDTPGAGGYSWTTDGGLFAQPIAYPLYGGAGGAPGTAGAHGGNSDSAGGVGGAAGNAIDGASFVDLDNSGTIAGPQIN